MTKTHQLNILLECSRYLALANHAALEVHRDDIAQEIRKAAWKVNAAIAEITHGQDAAAGEVVS